MKVTLKILLAAAVLLLVYICYRSIMTPIEFNEAKDARESLIKARLIDIRKAQIEYKNVYKTHAGSFNDLVKFLKEAVKKGLIRRDTIWVLAKDTLFGASYNADDLANVPGTSVKFSMDTATLTSGSGYTVKVFEAGVKYDDYLGDLDKQLVVNLKDKAEKLEKYPGLRVGSLTEINNNAGNWE